ncbi:LysR family transcriptional regulator [Sinorhizobium sp. BG8]|uniref:LysR family transcriptional regulator n=1 Tax=Sinorhizobium sp. BG8 TaxID=2613773 RepID=UPI00193E3446|nr:LysR family transcriptional regulator [Sinorhizobium sp. BG8]QRM53226.1 LysR family transcriptional regulator [Sinorhizobium sp. BG8]
MDLVSALQTFIRVSETGSFSAAADERHMTQPAISRQISALEQHFNTRLLHRTTSGVALTLEGERVIPLAMRILEAVDELGDTVGCDGTHASGKVRISLPAPLGLSLSDRLGDLLRQHPGLAVELVTTETSSNLVEAGFDLEVRLGPVSDSNLIGRRLGWTTAFLVASPDYLARHPAPRTLADIAAHHCISHCRGGDGRTWLFSDGSEDVAVRIVPRLQANNAVMVHRAAIAGAGLAVLSHILAVPDIAAGRLVSLLPEFPPARLPIHVVYPSRRNLPLRVRAVLDFLTELVREDPAMSAAS